MIVPNDYVALDLPVGWKWVALRDVTVRPARVDPRKSPVAFKYIDISSIDNSRSTITAPHELLGTDAPTRARQVVRSGDTLYSTVRVYLKNLARVPPDLDGAVASTGFCVLRPGQALDPRFLFYWVQTAAFTAQTSAMQRGISYPAINESELLEVAVPLAPLYEQKRIVAAIEEQLTRLDAATASLDASEVRSTRLASTVLRACLGGSVVDLRRPDQPTLTGLPNNWRSCKTGDVVTEARYGTSTKCEYEGRGVRVLRIPNIRDRRIDWSDIKHAVDTAEDLSRLYVRSGDVLVIRTNGSRSLIGKVGLVEHDYEAAFASYLIRLKPNISQISPAYLAAVLSSPSYRAVIEARAATTAGQYNLSIPALMSMPVPVPPLEAQEQLVAQVARWESVIESAARSCVSASRHARSLRSAILNAAFTGKLVKASVAAQNGPVPPTGLVPMPKVVG